MAQVDQVEQFKEEKAFFGLKKVDSGAEGANFHIIKYCIIVLAREREK